MSPDVSGADHRHVSGSRRDEADESGYGIVVDLLEVCQDDRIGSAQSPASFAKEAGGQHTLFLQRHRGVNEYEIKIALYFTMLETIVEDKERDFGPFRQRTGRCRTPVGIGHDWHFGVEASLVQEVFVAGAIPTAITSMQDRRPMAMATNASYQINHHRRFAGSPGREDSHAEGRPTQR